jgi:hypothetical protein
MDDMVIERPAVFFDRDGVLNEDTLGEMNPTARVNVRKRDRHEILSGREYQDRIMALSFGARGFLRASLLWVGYCDMGQQ